MVLVTYRVSLVPSTCQAINLLRSFIGRDTTAEVGTKWRQELGEAVGELDLLDLNYALYRCDQEERDDGHGGGAYVVPGAGALIYCGVEGIMSMMKTVRDNNDLGHPLCDNLRSGDWLAGYSVNRLRLRTGTKKVTRTHHERKPTYVTIYCYSRRESKGVCIQYSNIDCEYTEHSITTVSPSLCVCVGIQLADLLDSVFSELSKVPRYLIPCYFEAVLSLLHSLLKTRSVCLMSRSACVYFIAVRNMCCS